MARIRTIKPDAFISESLASVSLAAERTFFGLWTQADDAGRLKDRAAVLNGALWPLRPDHSVEDMESDLAALVEHGQICRYESAGMRLLHVVAWDDHQSINKATQSVLAPCLTHGRSKYDRDSALAKWASMGLYVPVAGDSGGVREASAAGAAGTLLEGSEPGQSGPQHRESRPAVAGVGDAAAMGATGVERVQVAGSGADVSLCSETEGDAVDGGSGSAPVVVREGSSVAVSASSGSAVGRRRGRVSTRSTRSDVTEGSDASGADVCSGAAALPDGSGSAPVVRRESSRGERERKGKGKGKGDPPAAAPLPGAGAASAKPAAMQPEAGDDRSQPKTDDVPPFQPASNDVAGNQPIAPERAASVSSAARGDMTDSPENETDEDMGIYDEQVDAFAAPVAASVTETSKKRRNVYVPKPDYDDAVQKLCGYLLRRSRANLTDAQAHLVQVTDEWQIACELMLRKDGWTPAQVSAVIEWATQDAFWRSNVRSMKKLREKFLQLGLHRDYIAWAQQNGKPLIAEGAAVKPTRAVDVPSAAKNYTSAM